MARKFITLLVALSVVGLPLWPPTAQALDVPQADPEKGLVIFYRSKKFSGAAVRFNVNHAEGSLGVLGSGTMVYRYFDPGQHQFWSQVISQDAITVDVEAGKVYFIKAETKMGVYAGRPKFERVDEGTGRKDVAGL